MKAVVNPSVILHTKPPLEDLELEGPLGHFPQREASRWELSIHEASHAIGSLELGVSISHAWVDESGSSGGVPWGPQPPSGDTAFEDYPEQIKRAAALQIATVFVAGVMGEALLLGCPIEGVLPRYCHDFRCARNALVHGFGDARCMWYCQRMALHIVSLNWAWVLATGKEIYRRGKLDAREIAELYRPPAAGLLGDGNEEQNRASDECFPGGDMR